MIQLAPLYPIIHQILKPTFPSCLWSGTGTSPTIALTFDDGPHPQHTPKLLKILDKYNITASFFSLGTCIQHSPSIAKQVYQSGHWLGLHGWTHQNFPSLSPYQLKQSLEQTQTAIAKACDLDIQYVKNNIRDVRPPNGIFTPQTLQYLQQWDYRPVMWSIVPEDWVRPGVSIVIERVMQQVKPGSLIVLHDGYCGGEDVTETAALLIPRLLDQGYQFVTIEQLWSCQKTPNINP
ncbi:MAG TPA: polysaccharide deacetylase family protein [Halomicronema sp.]